MKAPNRSAGQLLPTWARAKYDGFTTEICRFWPPIACTAAFGGIAAVGHSPLFGSKAPLAEVPPESTAHLVSLDTGRYTLLHGRGNPT